MLPELLVLGCYLLLLMIWVEWYAVSAVTKIKIRNLWKIYFLTMLGIVVSCMVMIGVVGRYFPTYSKKNLVCEAIYLSLFSSIFLVLIIYFGVVFLKKLSFFCFTSEQVSILKRLGFFLFLCIFAFFIHTSYILILDLFEKDIQVIFFFAIFEKLIYYFKIEKCD